MTDAPYIRPDMKAFLDMMAQVNGPKMVDMTLEEARDSYVKMHGIADRPARALPVIRIDAPDYALAYADAAKFPTGPWCKPGDWIIFGRYAGARMNIDGGEIRILNDHEMLATINHPEDIVHM